MRRTAHHAGVPAAYSVVYYAIFWNAYSPQPKEQYFLAFCLAQLVAAASTYAFAAMKLTRSPVVATWITIVLHFAGLLSVIQATGGMISSPLTTTSLTTLTVMTTSGVRIRLPELHKRLLLSLCFLFYLALLGGITVARLPSSPASVETVPLVFLLFIGSTLYTWYRRQEARSDLSSNRAGSVATDRV